MFGSMMSSPTSFINKSTSTNTKLGYKNKRKSSHLNDENAAPVTLSTKSAFNKKPTGTTASSTTSKNVNKRIRLGPISTNLTTATTNLSFQKMLNQAAECVEGCSSFVVEAQTQTQTENKTTMNNNSILKNLYQLNPNDSYSMDSGFHTTTTSFGEYDEDSTTQSSSSSSGSSSSGSNSNLALQLSDESDDENLNELVDTFNLMANKQHHSANKNDLSFSSSCNSSFQTRRCLFTTPTPDSANQSSAILKPHNKTINTQAITTVVTNKKNQLNKWINEPHVTPVSAACSASIITPDQNELNIDSDDEDESHDQKELRRLLNPSAKQQKKKEIVEEEISPSSQKSEQDAINEMIMRSLDFECNKQKTAMSSSSSCSSSFTSHKSMPTTASGSVIHPQLLKQSPQLIGDRSRYHSLPCTTSIKHTDLNVIEPHTLQECFDGKYSEQIDRLIVIDSRYPYEYDGGHIAQATNCFTKERVIEMFLSPQALKQKKRRTHSRRLSL